MATFLGNKYIGDIVKIKVNGVATEFIVVHQGNPDTSMYDSSCYGTWVLMKDCYTERSWDNTDNDYKNSDIHTYLNCTFLNFFDSGTKAAIKQVKIPYFNGNSRSGSVSSGANGLSVKIFLLGSYEVGWTPSDNAEFPIDGAKLSYFLSGKDTSANNKRIANYNGSAAIWNTRSPNTGNYRCVWGPGLKGDYYNNDVSNAYGIRPAFILPTTLNVDSSGNIIFNTAPTISGSSSSGSNLGEISAPFNFTYTVRDVDYDTVTVKEYLDNVLQRSYTASLGTTNTFQATSNAGTFQKILNGSHTIKVIANDGKENSAAYTVYFNKQIRTAVITLSTPLPADDVIKAAAISITGTIPEDAELEILATNNALDENPVWENMTQDYLKKINHVFSNKTAANGFAFNFKITATRGASGTQGYISSIGGAFE